MSDCQIVDCQLPIDFLPTALIGNWLSSLLASAEPHLTFLLRRNIVPPLQ